MKNTEREKIRLFALSLLVCLLRIFGVMRSFLRLTELRIARFRFAFIFCCIIRLFLCFAYIFFAQDNNKKRNEGKCTRNHKNNNVCHEFYAKKKIGKRKKWNV